MRQKMVTLTVMLLTGFVLTYCETPKASGQNQAQPAAAKANVSNQAAAQGPVQGPLAPEPPPTFEMDKKGGKRAHVNFALNPKPVSDANMKFSHFSNRKLIIFYFSAKCPHCQHAFPHVQQLADELTSQGFTAIAMAIKYNSEDDIRGFIRDYKVHIPVFQDEDRSFGENYGTGSIPLIVMVNDKGEYIRYKNFDANLTPAMMRSSAAQLAAK